jgi:hypothetical protein
MKADAIIPAIPAHIAAYTTRISTPALLFWGFFALHFLLALSSKIIFGMDIQSNTASHIRVGEWDWFLHTIPTANLLAHPLQSIWHLHSQPPMLNLLGALLMHLFYPHHLQALQLLYMLLGALAVGMAAVISLTLTKSVKFAVLVALYLALHSSLFIYEAYILYDILTLFQSTLALFLLCLYVRGTGQPRLGYLAAFLLVLATLTLTRSLYHLALLLPATFFAGLLAGAQWKRMVVVGLCCILLPLGWYTKNSGQVGIFGASSWLGLSLWQIASYGYSDAELAHLADAGVIDPVVAEVTAFNRPARYVAYGFDAQSENPEWARDDFNNINIPAIAKEYQHNALRLVTHDPARYLQAVFSAFYIFCNPASQFPHVAGNAAKLGAYEGFYTAFLQGNYPFRLVGMAGSYLVILLPFTLILYLIQVLQHAGLSWTRWLALVRADAPMIFAALLILYTVAVSCFFEYGENFRFKLGIEIPLWLFVAAVLYRRYRRRALLG